MPTQSATILMAVSAANVTLATPVTDFHVKTLTNVHLDFIIVTKMLFAMIRTVAFLAVAMVDMKEMGSTVPTLTSVKMVTTNVPNSLFVLTIWDLSFVNAKLVLKEMDKFVKMLMNVSWNQAVMQMPPVKTQLVDFLANVIQVTLVTARTV